MAKENGAPTAAEKGKGKMVDEKPSDGPKSQDDTKKDKDGKPIANGKPGDEPLEGMVYYKVLHRSLANHLRANRRLERRGPESQE